MISIDNTVQEHVHLSEVSNLARSIVDHIGELAPDLVILCTHGRGGLRDILIGSIAQQVIAIGETPVLLIHPRESGNPEPFNCDQVLLPLDGSPDHEIGIPYAKELAILCGSKIH